MCQAKLFNGAYGFLNDVVHVEPTPLTPITHPAGLNAYMKRDDLCSVGDYSNPSGKLRKIVYILREAEALGADTIIVSGNLQSNHARMLAQVCAQRGLPVHCVYQNDTGDYGAENVRGGNVMLADLSGATIHVVEPGTSSDEYIKTLVADLVAQGHTPYVSTRGGSNSVGDVGYFHAAIETCLQMSHFGYGAATMYVCSGSGGTHAGLHLGAAYLRYNNEFDLKIVGVPNKRTLADQRTLVNSCIDNLRRTILLPRNMLVEEVRFDEVNIPYGVVDAEVADAARAFYKATGVLLDPIYTVKTLIAMQRVVDHDNTVPIVLLNGGAATNAFAYRGSFQEWSINYERKQRQPHSAC